MLAGVAERLATTEEAGPTWLLPQGHPVPRLLAPSTQPHRQEGKPYAMQALFTISRSSGFTVSPTPASGAQCEWTNPPLLQILREPCDGEALLEVGFY